MVARVMTIVREFSAEDLAPGVIVNLVAAENAEFEGHGREHLLEFVHIFVEVSWTKLKQVRHAVAFLKEEKSRVLREQVVQDWYCSHYELLYPIIISELE